MQNIKIFCIFLNLFPNDYGLDFMKKLAEFYGLILHYYVKHANQKGNLKYKKVHDFRIHKYNTSSNPYLDLYPYQDQLANENQDETPKYSSYH
jgi:hypothetical protein